MFRTLALLVLALPLLLSGCGTVLATFESDSIEDDPGERSLAQQVEDESIETKAVVNLRAENELFDDLRFVVVSYNGYVLIAGEVPKQELKDQASDVLRDIEGVRRIYNELVVGEKSSTETEANDVWITTKVKSILFADSDIQSIRVKVVTENSVVYLMGLLTPAEADRVAEKTAGIDGVKKVVRLFELI